MKHIKDYEFWLLLAVITLGIAYRFIDLTVPDFSTDEAQFALGQSAAQPPLGMWFFRFAQMIFGPTILVARLVSVGWGIAAVAGIGLVARLIFDKRTAWWAAAIAAMMPSAILYSRLAYLTSCMSVIWLISIYAFLRATDQPRKPWFWLLFVGSNIAAGFTQSQGLLLALLLTMSMWVATSPRRYNWSEKCIAMSSVVPGLLYIVFHPQILVSFTLVGGSESHMSLTMRALELVRIWLILLGPFALCLIGSAREIKQSRLPIILLLATGLLLSLILTPRPYYATYALFFALPIAAFLVKRPLAWRVSILTVLSLYTALRLGPVALVGRTVALEPFNAMPYWNTHTDTINAAVQNHREIVVYGNAGHHIRWYLEPTVFVGTSMPSVPATPVLVLNQSSVPAEVSTRNVLYTDEHVQIYDSH